MISAILLGIAVGIISVITGLGGGVLLVPLFPTFFKMSQHQAVATSLFVILLNSSQLVLLASKNRMIEFRGANIMVVPGIVFSLIASWNLYYFTDWFLKMLLFLSLLLATWLLIFPIKRQFQKTNFLGAFIGALGGAISGFTGLGGGVIVGSLAFGFRLIPVRYLAPTISFVTMIFALTAISVHVLKTWQVGWDRGPIQVKIGLLVFLFAFITSRLLYPLQKKLPDRYRKVFLMMICAVLLAKAFYNLL